MLDINPQRIRFLINISAVDILSQPCHKTKNVNAIIVIIRHS
jgi:hypothetical protein